MTRCGIDDWFGVAAATGGTTTTHEETFGDLKIDPGGDDDAPPPAR